MTPTLASALSEAFPQYSAAMHRKAASKMEKDMQAKQSAPKFESESCADGTVALCCPRCGGDYVHPYYTNVYFRDAEDSPTGVRAEVIVGEVKVKSSMDGNPSPRRDGVAVGFVCEGCQYDCFELCIWQHKGRTFFHVQ